jgi:signal peptidase I
MKCKKCGSKNVKQEENKIICNDCGETIEIKKKSKLRETIDFLSPIIIAVILALLLKTFIFANAVVPTGSMLNTIHEGDRIIASRIEYKFNDPERYDIIIFKAPDEVAKGNEKEFYVKRIIGLPGETITIVNGVVYITDTSGTTSQARDEFITACIPTGNFGPYTIPENSYFVMGDNRESSIDSRYWVTTNYVDRDLIIGKVKFRYYPIKNFGKLDNFE